MNRIFILLTCCLFFLMNIQGQEVIYSINEYVTTNLVKVNQSIPWGQTRNVQSSYILLRLKSDQTIYLQITISGQFTYGGYFKFLGKEGTDFKYIRSDETGKKDYIFVNYPLTTLGESQKYDEYIVMKLLNYQTSYGLLLKF